MSKQKAGRNKTIDMTVEEGKELLKECVTIEQAVVLSDILDKTVYGDTFSALAHFPRESVDLLIADPPYNLTKSFDGNVFAKRIDVASEALEKEFKIALELEIVALARIDSP